MPPQFPSSFVIERTRRLGFGSGPWTRDRLVAREEAATTADKYIFEAKAAGWLVSPYRGIYQIPPAQDLMVVSWLPPAERDEFLVSRNLQAAKLNYWCLSAWCRRQGLDLGGPVFVTDLQGPGQAPPPLTPDLKAFAQRSRAAALPRENLPFLEALLIVPQLPLLEAPAAAEFALVPQDRESEARRRGQKQVAEVASSLIALVAMAAKKEAPNRASPWGDWERQQVEARGIPYTLGPRVEDDAWILALLAAIGTPRTEEFINRTMDRVAKTQRSRVQQWANVLGPPQPNAAWKPAILDGPFPYLLVPPLLWRQMGADQASRRFRVLGKLAGG